MKLEIVKETKLNGDIFIRLHKNDNYVSDSSCYGGNELTSPIEEIEKYYKEAIERLNKLMDDIKQDRKPKIEVIHSEDIETN
jgi:hypothetical protein